MKTIKLLFWVSRPVSWINTAYPFAAGMLVTGSTIGLPLIVGTVFFLIPYNLLMYGVNDVFDYESDIRNPRKGGIEGALAPATKHRTILLGSVGLALPFLLYLLTLGSWPAKLWLTALLVLVVGYSAPPLRLKERPVLDSLTSSLHFVGPLIYALLLQGFSSLAWPAVLAFTAWGMASHAFGAVQDVEPDRKAGIASIATVFGARRTIWLIISLYALAGILVASYGPLGIIVGCSSLPYIWNAWQFRAITDATSAQANAGWRRFIWMNWLTGAVVTIALIYGSL